MGSVDISQSFYDVEYKALAHQIELVVRRLGNLPDLVMPYTTVNQIKFPETFEIIQPPDIILFFQLNHIW